MTVDSNASYLPARIDQFPPESRLLSSLAALPQIITRVKQEERNQRAMEKLQEIISSRSPFERNAAVAAQRINSFLKPETEKPVQFQLNGKTPSEVLRHYALGQQEAKQDDNNANIKQLKQRLAVLLHSDTHDPIIAQLFSNDERVKLYSQAIEAADNNNLHAAQQIYLKVIPQYYQHLVDHFRSQGLSLTQISQVYPNLLPDIELARYLAHTLLPSAQAQTVESDQMIDEASQQIAKRKRIYSRGNGFLSLIHSTDDMIDYCEKHHENSPLSEALQALRNEMTPIGFSFGQDAAYVESTGFFNDPESDLAEIIDENLAELPLEFMRVAHTLKVNPSSSVSIILDLKAKLAILSKHVHAFHHDLDITPQESNQITNELKDKLQELLGENEEKTFSGVRLKVAKEPKGTIWDTHIQWYEYTNKDNESTTSRQTDCILIGGNWWSRTKSQRTWWMGNGFSFIMPLSDHEDTSEDFFAQLLGFQGNRDSDALLPKTPLEEEARKYHFKPASVSHLQKVMDKLLSLSTLQSLRYETDGDILRRKPLKSNLYT